MPMHRWAVLVVLAAGTFTAAGCTEAATDHRLSGSFTADPRPDWAAFEAIVANYTDEPAAILESFPEQFQIFGLSAGGCEALRGELAGLDYVATVGDCRTA